MAFLVGLLAAAPLLATTIVVNDPTDTLDALGNCSLREAIIAANTDSAQDGCAAGSGDDTIVLGAATYVLGLSGSDDLAAVGDLDITANLTINGSGANATVIDATGLSDRAFQVISGGAWITGIKVLGGGGAGRNGGAFSVETGSSYLTLEGVEIEGASADNGGAIFVASSALANVAMSTLTGNSASNAGGAIFCDGQLNLSNSTISANTAGSGNGGGISLSATSTAGIFGCTIAYNTTSGGLGVQGVDSLTPPSIGNTILAYNAIGDCSEILDNAHNIVLLPGCIGAGDSGRTLLGVDPYLEPLALNGGSVRTHNLAPKSPAIDQGNSCDPTDEIGTPRPQGTRCDIGALEIVTLPGCGGAGWPVAVPFGPWVMFSPPCDTFLATPGAMFADDMGAGIYDSDWVLWGRDSIADVYTKLGVASPTLPVGNGYWFRTLVPPAGGALTSPGSEYSASLSIPQVGYVTGRANLLGNPYTTWISWPDVLVNYLATDHSLSQAQTDGMMQKLLYKWNGATYLTFDPDVPGLDGIIWRGEAFWTMVFDPSGTQLVLPAPPPPNVAGKESPTPAGVPHRPASLGPGEWMVRLTASSDRFVDPGNLFGRLEGASIGWDAKDLPEMPPPSFATTWLTVVFPHADWGERAGSYTTDFRPFDRLRGDSWDFEVRSSIQDRPITLAWSGPPEVVGCSRLFDLTTGEVVATDASRSYTFTLDAPGRLFRWILDGPTPGEIRRRPTEGLQ
jgi:CSLREA domain-containing protein